MKISLVIFVLLCACQRYEKKASYFDQMPRELKMDSLEEIGREMIKDLTVKDVKWKDDDVIQISNSDCNNIPFCGYLTYKSDTIFYSTTLTGYRKPFLIFNSERFSKWTIEYRRGRVDEITYLELMPDREKKGDSLYLFMLAPQKMKGMHSVYLHLLAIKKGGIKLLTFSNYRDIRITIALHKYPKVVYYYLGN